MKRILILASAITLSIPAMAQPDTAHMETWKNYQVGILPPLTALEIPAGWHGSDSLVCMFGPLFDPSGNYEKQIFKTTDSHSGSFAARLVTKSLGTPGVLPAVMSNATMTLDTSNAIPIKFHGGVPVTQRLNYVNAWVKYIPAGSDETQMYVEAVITGAGANGDDSVIGTGIGTISASNVYEQVSAKIDYALPGTMPDRIRVAFFSSFGAPEHGSELYVDEVSISEYPVAITRIFGNEEAVKVYPTVSTGKVYFEPVKTHPMQLHIYNPTGQLIIEKQLAGKDIIDLEHLSGGMYFYTIHMNGVHLQNGKICISR